MSDAGAQQADRAALEPEEQARADLYGLISRLFYGPPDSKLLAEVSRVAASAEDAGDGAHDNPLSRAWRELQEACRTTYPAIVRQEYDGLFVGVGKAPVTPYLSAYAEPHAPDRHLLRLREQLGAWGLARRDSAFELEDHISAVCDVMRWLIENHRPLAEQNAFFEDFVYKGAVAFFAATQKNPAADFYQEVVDLALQFLDVEKSAFDME